MPRIAAVLAAALLIPGLAVGAGVDLGVAPATDAAITLTEEDGRAWTVEAENPGSAPVHGRLHVAVAANNTTTFTAWSDTLTLQPGDAAARTLSVPPGVRGRGTITFRYGAHTTPPVNVTVPALRNASPLDIPVVRAYPGRVRVGVDAPAGEQVVVTVHDGSTRIFAQQRAANGGGTTYVDVPVHPPLKGSATLHVTAHTPDGGYGRTVVRDVDVLTGVSRVVWQVLDSLTAGLT